MVCNFSEGRSCRKRPASRSSSETQNKHLTGIQLQTQNHRGAEVCSSSFRLFYDNTS